MVLANSDVLEDAWGMPGESSIDDIVYAAGNGASRFTNAWSIGSGYDRFRGGGIRMSREQVSFSNISVSSI